MGRVPPRHQNTTVCHAPSIKGCENPFLDQRRHNDWARSSEEIQWAMMTKRRRSRFNRCRPSNALDAHREDPGDDERGTQLMGVQNNNQHCRYVSFSRKKGQLESQPMMTQKLAPADHRQAKEGLCQDAPDVLSCRCNWHLARPPHCLSTVDIDMHVCTTTQDQKLYTILRHPFVLYYINKVFLVSTFLKECSFWCT